MIENFLMSNNYFSGDRHEVFALLDGAPKNVLEVGCGEGRFRNHFPSDCTYWGIEPHEIAHRKAAGSLTECILGTWETSTQFLPDNFFDLIVANDVIEHMKNPEIFLQQAKDKLKPGGMILGSVPNIKYWKVLHELIFENDFRYREAGTLDKTHLRFFTKVSLERLFREEGFLILKIVPLGVSKIRYSSIPRAWRSIQMLLYGPGARHYQYGFLLKPSG